MTVHGGRDFLLLAARSGMVRKLFVGNLIIASLTSSIAAAAARRRRASGGDWLRCDWPRRVRDAKGRGRHAGARTGYEVIGPGQSAKRGLGGRGTVPQSEKR